MMSMPDAICLRIAGIGMDKPIRTMVSRRESMSCGLFPCPVLRLPSCLGFSL